VKILIAIPSIRGLLDEEQLPAERDGRHSHGWCEGARERIYVIRFGKQIADGPESPVRLTMDG